MTESYMLDTNTVSHLLRGDLSIREKLLTQPDRSVTVSVVTEGELLFGLAKRTDNNSRLIRAVSLFLGEAVVLPWTSDTANSYAKFRARSEARGQSLGPLDTMIAAHAISVGAVLVTDDQAFYQHKDIIMLESWR